MRTVWDVQEIVLELTKRDLSPREAALAYKELWRVGRAFREIKSFLEIRPMYLSREDHVKGHVAICFPWRSAWKQPC